VLLCLLCDARQVLLPKTTTWIKLFVDGVLDGEMYRDMFTFKDLTIKIVWDASFLKLRLNSDGLRMIINLVMEVETDTI
jgi:hypothetical protein